MTRTVTNSPMIPHNAHQLLIPIKLKSHNACLNTHPIIVNMFPREESSTKDDSNGIKIEERRLGVWTLRTAVPSTILRSPRELWVEFRKAAPFILRLFGDIFNVSPHHLIVYLACQFAEGLEEVLILGFSDKLLRTVSYLHLWHDYFLRPCIDWEQSYWRETRYFWSRYLNSIASCVFFPICFTKAV